MTELAGVRYRWLTFFSQRLPGTPSSRLKAKSMRPAEAMDENPQNVMAMATPTARRPPRLVRPAPRFCSRMYCDAATPPLLARTSAGRGHLQGQRHEDDVAGDRGHGHRQEHAPGRRPAGDDRLLGHVGRRVVPGVGPLRLEQAQRERARDTERNDLFPRCSVGDAPAGAIVNRKPMSWVGWCPEGEERDGDRDHEEDVPPHRQVVHERHDPRARHVEDRSRSAIRTPVIQIAFWTPSVSALGSNPRRGD